MEKVHVAGFGLWAQWEKKASHRVGWSGLAHPARAGNRGSSKSCPRLGSLCYFLPGRWILPSGKSLGHTARYAAFLTLVLFALSVATFSMTSGASNETSTPRAFMKRVNIRPVMNESIAAREGFFSM